MIGLFARSNGLFGNAGNGNVTPPISGYVVGATGNYPTIQAAINAATLAGATRTSPIDIYIQPGTYAEAATSHIITMTTGINLVGLDQNYNGLVFDAANANDNFNKRSAVIIQAKFVFTRSAGKCFNTISNVFIDPPTSSVVFESPYSMVLNNTIISLNTSCIGVQTTPATLGAAGFANLSLNSSMVIPTASNSSKFVVMSNTTILNTLRITLTNSAIYDASGTSIGTGSSNSLYNRLEVEMSGSCWSSAITGQDNTSYCEFKAENSSIGKGLTKGAATATMFSLFRALINLANCINYCITTFSNLDPSNTLQVQIFNTNCLADSYLWDIASPLNYVLFNVTTNVGTLNTGTIHSAFSNLTISNENYLQTTDATPTVLTAIDINTFYSVASVSGTIKATTGNDVFVANYLVGGWNTGSPAVTLTDNPILNKTFTSALNPGVTFVANNSSGTIDITATGIAATNINWTNTYQYNVSNPLI